MTGCEGWTIRNKNEKIINAAEMLPKTLKNQLDRKEKQHEYIGTAKYKHRINKHD